MTKAVATKKETKAETVTPTDIIAAVEDTSDNDICFDYRPTIKDQAGQRVRVSNVTDTPLVYVGGIKVELTESKMTDIPAVIAPFIRHLNYQDDLLVRTTSEMASRRMAGKWSTRETLSAKTAKWYTFEMAGIKVFITQGSELIINESFRIDNYYDFDGSEPDDGEHVLVIVGSSIVANRFDMRGIVYFNNSRSSVRDTYSLTRTSVVASEVNSNRYAGIHKSYLTGTTICDTESLSVTDSNIDGFTAWMNGDINLREVRTYGEFRLNIYTGNVRFNFLVEKTTLHPWNSYIHLGNKAQKYVPDEKYSVVNNLRVDSRVDYGYFSAVQSIPFIRLGNHDVIVGQEIFTAKEFFPELFLKPDEEVETVRTLDPRPFGHFGGYVPTPLTPPTWARTERNGDLWHRAAKVIFDNNNKAIGKVGESLISSLLEQIKSRIGLFIEIKTLDL